MCWKERKGRTLFFNEDVCQRKHCSHSLKKVQSHFYMFLFIFEYTVLFKKIIISFVFVLSI
jgi:hypothetical protein